MTNQEYPSEFLQFIENITNKRAKIVIEHIMEHGFITTRTLEVTYGYSHPPRAARDVREEGIPLETFSLKSAEGKSIAAYKFGDLSKIQYGKLGGRSGFSKKFKKQLYAQSNGKCAICNGTFEERYLQIDHKIPYQIGGESPNSADYMLLCASCNRSKSWSCENCENWATHQNKQFCYKCYWGNPQNYDHIALKPSRRLALIWEEGETETFEAIKQQADFNKISLSEYIKKLIKKIFE